MAVERKLTVRLSQTRIPARLRTPAHRMMPADIRVPATLAVLLRAVAAAETEIINEARSSTKPSERRLSAGG